MVEDFILAMTGLATELPHDAAKNRVAVSFYDEKVSSYHVQVGLGFFSSPAAGKGQYLLFETVEVMHPFLQSYEHKYEELLRLAVAVAVIYCQKRIGLERESNTMVLHLWNHWREGIINMAGKKRERAILDLITGLLRLGMHPEDLAVLPKTFGYTLEMDEGRRRKVSLKKRV